MSGLYIHIPFCARKCAYCDFVSFAEHGDMARYLELLRVELRLRAEQGDFQSFDTVFIGGGTPSLLPLGAMEGILGAVRKSFTLAPGAEISMESNPGTLTPDKLKEYRAAGIERLSMGLQSADDGLLKRIGRIHTWEDFLHSFTMARAAGFDNINVDVMYGLPEQTLAQHIQTLQEVSALCCEHISAYSLILEEHTPLYEQKVVLPDEDAVYAMHRATIDCLQARGYTRYEISNYARPGRECRHNINYWNNGMYLGVGLNAHSAWRMDGEWTRFYNTANMRDYLDALARGTLPEGGRERIERTEEMFECVMLGLRKTEGFSAQKFFARFGAWPKDVYATALAALKARGWLSRCDARIALNDAGLDMQNRALLYFL